MIKHAKKCLLRILGLMLAGCLAAAWAQSPGPAGATRAEPAAAADTEPPPALRLSPRVRVQLMPQAALPALEPHRIEPFLVEPLIVDDAAFEQAPRIVAAPEGRVLITRGDRA